MCIRVSREIDTQVNTCPKSDRKRTDCYQYAVKHLLIDLWKAHCKHPDAECSINKRSGYYSENARYRDPQLTYKLTVEQAFKGLIDLDLIRITKEGFYDRITYEGSLTRFKATHKLAEQFNELKGHPSVFLEPNLDVETIILRDTIDGKEFFKL